MWSFGGRNWQILGIGGSSVSFVNSETRKIDAAGRVAIPAMYRKDLSDTVYITKSLQKEPCIVVMSETGWKELEYNFMVGVPPEKLQWAKRWLSSRVERVSIDKAGRIAISDVFREFANLTDEVLVFGAVDTIELWNPKAYLERCAAVDIENDDDFAEIASRIPYSIARKPE